MENKKILGLDIGTASIGYSLINTKNDKLQNIIKIGVLTFSDSRDSKSKKPNNSARRDSRLIARQYDRKKTRKDNLIKYITKNILNNNLNTLNNIFKINPYLARNKSVANTNLHNVLRSLLFISNKRGYLDIGYIEKYNKTILEENSINSINSNINITNSYLNNPEQDNVLSAEEKAKAKEKEGLIKKIHTLQNELTDYKTLGQYLYINKAKKFTNENKLYASREMYLQEFEVIKQANNNLLTPEQWQIIKKIIFYQRPLKIQTHLIGKCIHNSNEYKANKIQPLAEDVRIWQTLNNLQYTLHNNEVKKIYNLSLEIKESIINNNSNIKDVKNKIAKANNCKVKDIEFMAEEPKLIFPKTIKALNQFFTDHNLCTNKLNSDLWLQYNIIALSLYEQPLKPLPQIQTQPTETNKTTTEIINQFKEQLTTLLKENNLLPYNVNDTDFINDLQYKLNTLSDKNKGHANLGFSTLKGILPNLQQTKNTVYSTAIEQYKASIGLVNTSHSNLQTTEEYNELPDYQKVLINHLSNNKIPNPTVHVVLNNLKKLVNGLLTKYGNIDEIKIELARDILNSKKVKDDIDKQNKENENINTQATQHGIDKTKYKLYLEITNQLKLAKGKSKLNFTQPAMCVYCGQTASLNTLNTFEIEHIIPKSIYYNNSLSNLTLACSSCNKNKNNNTPKTWLQNNPTQYKDLLNRIKVLPKSKQKLFTTSNQEVNPEDFASGQLNDTRYISKVALEYLKCLKCVNSTTSQTGKNVIATKGQITSNIRYYLGLNNILEYKDGTPTNQTKNRADNRHHAIDAFVVCLTSRGLIQAINTDLKHSSNADNNEDKKKFAEIAKKYLNFTPENRTQLKEHLNKIIVYKKLNHSLTGAFFNETAYGYAKYNPSKLQYTITERKTIQSIKKLTDVEKIKDNHLKSKLEKVFKDLQNATTKDKEKKLQQFSQQHNVKKVKIVNTTDDFIPIKNKNNQIYKGYGNDGYAFVDIWEYPETKNNKQQTAIKPVFVSYYNIINWFCLKNNPSKKLNANMFSDSKQNIGITSLKINNQYPKPHRNAKLKLRLFKNDYVAIIEKTGIATVSNNSNVSNSVLKVMYVTALEKSGNGVKLRYHLKTRDYNIRKAINTSLFSNYQLAPIKLDILGNIVSYNNQPLKFCSNAIKQLVAQHNNLNYSQNDILKEQKEKKAETDEEN